MPDPNAYTVGWICAVTKELVAAQALLDEKHAEPNHVPVNDNNSYTLGRIGEHYVVIAALPHWQYGIANAATVAQDMVHSFPNVRIGLMVGIGSGVPTKHDIRLGDVVALPATAVLERNPRLRKQYQRPDLSTDGLYEAEFVYASGGANCVTACDESRLIHRVARSTDEDNPKVYYGLIASGNKLIKNAVVRDRLSAEKDVLCFEMEAARLMNHFPCVVIRGICDYSDSHKNEEWQGYAAMVAAAYAKDLLCQIPPNKVEAERRIEEVLAGVVGTISKTGENVEAVRFNLDRNEDHKILNWLTPIDYGPQQSDTLKRWQPGTGQWLLQSEEFQDWLATSKQTLFCPGIPGAGKTILTSIVVDDLSSRFHNDSKTGIAYIYCDFRRHNEQKIDDLLASVLKQLAESQSSLPENVKDLYDRCKGKRTRPSLDEISRVLHSVAAIYSRVFIIVDALDECQVFDHCRSKFLSEAFSLQAETGANLLVTSRFIRDITAEFEGRSMSLTIRATGEDVLTYLAGQMDRLPSFVKSSPDLQNLIKATISKVVDGMFLLAPLHIDALAREPTVGDIESALQNLSRGTDEIYKQALIRIESQGGRFRDLAKKVLSWVVHAKRVLSTTELQHALAVKPGEPELNEKFIPSTDIIGSICAGLVTIDAKSDVVRLIHYTTQEYLEQTHNIWFPEAESAIATICVTYLSFSAFETGYCKTDDEFEERLQLNPVYDYAAHNWGHHARQALTLGQELGQEVIDFIRCLPKLEASSQVMMAPKQGSWGALYSQRFPTQMTGLHLAGYFGA
ncbi:nucleoside phosphorylase domain-containing protein [Leptodontidium sp. 2 PMI_412]|nr:nucleoside phosphorylase domain-containing protein [Leptodontidium sp. 2 PMI_412]